MAAGKCWLCAAAQRSGVALSYCPAAVPSLGLVRASRWWFSNFSSESRRRWPTVRVWCVGGLR
jgi:hypothetical protein